LWSFAPVAVAAVEVTEIPHPPVAVEELIGVAYYH